MTTSPDYGHEVSLDAYGLSPHWIAEMPGRVGLVVHATRVREPEPPERTRQAYLIAQARGLSS